ncbi:MAG TPA: rhomboid family intramembrane serine protease [Thermoguttaceae bacterium]|nr:rhomboid family intramembrane serine protease [Thermoguttaceae bacterium]
MFLPYSTDAPIYHWPAATVGLIVVNVVAFVAMMVALESAEDVEAVMPYLLHLGRGIYPWQWLTANFLHANLLHLAGNMLGLWTFGLIVEGKVGWGWFLGIYLGVGVVALAIWQILSLGMAENYGLGASGIVYGLMAIGLVWAPENEVSCFTILWFRLFFFEIRIWIFAVIYMVIQILIMVVSGLTLGSEAVHLMGLALGAVVGVVMLRQDWVDCENWDVFSVWAGRNTMSPEELEALEPGPTPKSREEVLQEIHEILAEGRFELALTVHRRMAASLPDWRLPEPDLRRLIQGCLRTRRHADAVALMVDYLRTYRDQAAAVRLKLAEVLLVHDERPGQARRVLAKLADDKLTPQQRHRRRLLDKRATAMLDEGALDVETEDW